MEKNEIIYTGFMELDKLTGGFKKGELILIGGRPAMGKTAFACELVQNVGVNMEKRLIIFFLESPNTQLLNRITVWYKKNDFYKIKTKGDFNVIIPLTDNIKVEDIKRDCEIKLNENGRLDLIIIDYLQLIQCDEQHKDRNEQIREILTDLKILAKDLNIPIVVLSQLSRSLESRKDKHPILTDLRGSKSIREIPDKILFIYRDDYYDMSNPDKNGIAEIIVAKNNTGETGTVNLLFDKKMQNKLSNSNLPIFNTKINEENDI